MRGFLLIVFLACAKLLFAQDSVANNPLFSKRILKRDIKAEAQTPVRLIEYDFNTEELSKVNSVKTGELVRIKVKNINTLLYNVRFIVDQQDYTIPAAYSTPLNFFNPPTASNTANTTTTESTTTTETKPVSSEDTKDLEENVKKVNEEVKKNKNKSPISTGAKLDSIYKGVEDQYRLSTNTTIYNPLLEILNDPKQIRMKADAYNDRLKEINYNIDTYRIQIRNLELLNVLNEKMILLAASSNRGLLRRRLIDFDAYWQRMYSKGDSIRTFMDAIDGFRRSLLFEIPENLERLEAKISELRNDDYFKALISKDKREMNDKSLNASLQNLRDRVNTIQKRFGDSIYNLENRYIMLKDTTLFRKVSKPITVYAKDYMNITIKITPIIQNVLFTRNLAPGEVGVQNLEESEFTFKQEVRKSWAINFSTGFILNFGPKNENYNINSYKTQGDTVLVRANSDNSFLSTVSYGGFVHFYRRAWREVNWGGTFGLGLNSDLSNVSMLIGLNLIIGKAERIILTAGLNTYKVDVLKGRYSYNPISQGFLLPKDDAPKEITELVEKKYKAGFGVALTFNLSPRTRQ